MEIKDLLQQKQDFLDKNKNKKEGTAWGSLGEDMTKFFWRNCYWLPYRYEEWKLLQALKTCQQERKGFQYFLGILKKL